MLVACIDIKIDRCIGYMVFIDIYTSQSLSSAQSPGGEGEGCLDCCSQYNIENIPGQDGAGRAPESARRVY